jgi:hypothetical protein
MPIIEREEPPHKPMKLKGKKVPESSDRSHMSCLTLAALVFMLMVPSADGAEPTVTTGLPADVAMFKKHRDLCDHFRGEEPYDAERRAFLEESLKKYCTGTDQELASLRTKYKNNVVVLKVLSAYEDAIEPME